MIDYDRHVIAAECERLRDHIGVLLRELPETGKPEDMPSDVVSGMAIAYKLIRGMLHARAEKLSTPQQLGKGTR